LELRELAKEFLIDYCTAFEVDIGKVEALTTEELIGVLKKFD
jgi:hypothetical protein